MRIEENVALIESPLLCSAIWGNYSCLYPNCKMTGYVEANIDLVGKAFIEYCLARVLGIFRLPNCGYDNYTNSSVWFNEISEHDVDEACKEMELIIKHVQEKLLESGRVVDGKVSVVRCLSHYQLRDAALQLIDESSKNIVFPVSIFSSYSYDGNVNIAYPSGRTENGKHINIKEKIPVEDIVLWDQYVGNGRKKCGYCKSMYDEERELWVVDRSVTGMKKLPRENFIYSDGLPDTNGKAYNKKAFGTDTPLYSGLYQKRPCEYKDVLTKFVMKKNIKKLENEYRECGQ